MDINQGGPAPAKGFTLSHKNIAIGGAFVVGLLFFIFAGHNSSPTPDVKQDTGTKPTIVTSRQVIELTKLLEPVNTKPTVDPDKSADLRNAEVQAFNANAAATHKSVGGGAYGSQVTAAAPALRHTGSIVYDGTKEKDSKIVTPLASSLPRSAAVRDVVDRAVEQAPKETPMECDPDNQLQRYILPEDFVIEALTINKLNGDFVGPVKASVRSNVYFPGTRIMAFPKGSELFGEASAVARLSQSRLTVEFNRIRVPMIGGSGCEISLLRGTPGLDQEGAAALKDKVNNHFASIFGASLAIGAIGGLANIGNNYSGGGYSAGTQFRSGISSGMSSSSERVLDRFLNRLPTVIIRPGTLIEIMLTGNLTVPEYPVQ